MFRAIIIISIFSSVAFAQSGSRSIDQKIHKKRSKLAFLIDRKLQDLNRTEKEDLNDVLREAIIILGGTSGGHPPGSGHGRSLMSVAGTIEGSTRFSFDVSSTAELMSICVPDIQRKVKRSVDDIELSIDFGRIQRVTTSGWWKTPLAVCAAVSKKAISQGLPEIGRRDREDVIMITFENQRSVHTLKGRSKRELFSQCESAHRSTVHSSIDDIQISINGNGLSSITTSGWWRNSFEACSAVIERIQ